MFLFLLFGIIGLLIILAIPAGIIYGIVVLVRRSGASSSGVAHQTAERVPGGAERVFTYVLSFVGLMAVLFGLSSLLALAFLPVIPDASTLISADDVRVRVSYSLAALIVGAPLWLGLWRHAQKRATSNPAERHSVERRLYLAAIFGAAAIVSLIGAVEALSAIILLIGNGERGSLVKDAVTGGSLVAVYGAAWVGYARFGWRERAPSADDWMHDLAVYAVTGTAFLFLLFGLGNILHELIRQMQGAGSLLIAGNGWGVWNGPLASTVVGGVAWWALQRYDVRRSQPRILRVVYLYGVLLFVAPLAVYFASTLLYELLRRGFGYSEHATNWNFLADVLPWLAVGVAFWAYHWLTIRAQARLQPATSIVRPAELGVIPYPRRPALALAVAAGTVLVSIGTAMAIWIGIDAALSTHGALSGGAWWRDQVSASVALLVVGGALWLPAWSLLQQAVTRVPAVEQDTTARRWLLSGLALGGALVALGFGITLLYQILRTVLGQTDANTLSDTLRYGSTTIVALSVAAYYGSILRATMNRQAKTPAVTRVRLAVLLAPGSDAVLAQVLGDAAVQVEIMGYISTEEFAAGSDLQTLRASLALLGAAGQADRALLVLGPSGGHLYPYTGRVPGEVVRAGEESLVAPLSRSTAP